MTETAGSRQKTASVPRQSVPLSDGPSGWVGWITFAGIMLTITGCLNVFQGLVAVLDDEYYLVTKNGLSVKVDYTTWGWTHIVIGAVVILAALALMAGKMWGRVFGVIVAAISLLANFAFIASYPFWSTIVIALDVFVIFALTAHGKEMNEL